MTRVVKPARKVVSQKHRQLHQKRHRKTQHRRVHRARKPHLLHPRPVRGISTAFSRTNVTEDQRGGDVWLQHVELADEADTQPSSDNAAKAKDLKEAKAEAAHTQGVFSKIFHGSPKQARATTKEDVEMLQDEEGWMQKATKKSVVSVGGSVSFFEFLRKQFRNAPKAKKNPQQLPTGSGKKSPPKSTFLLDDAEGQVSPEAEKTNETNVSAARKVQDARTLQQPTAQNSGKKPQSMPLTAEQDAARKPPEEISVRRIAPPHRQKSKLVAALSSISHIGLGKERALFIQNLATMLNAGLPIIDTLKTLQLETRSRSMRKIMQNILDSVENGSPLWRAMDDQNIFSPHSLALVRIGEEGGNLAENIAYLAIQEEKDSALRGKVKMAMIYPSIVLVLMFVVVMGLGLFVLPNLIQVLFSLNVPLPFVTRMIVLFTNVFTTYGSIAVPGSIASFLFLIILAKFTPLRVVFQWVLFRIPGIGRLAREATIARFGVILGGLLHAGVPLTDALKSLTEVTPIVSYRRFYAKLYDHIIIGDSFSKSFNLVRNSKKLLPPSVQQLVVTGERSGALSDIMLKIADIYDKKASETAQKLPVILEPMLLLFIGGLVGTIAFAIIVPIYSVVGSVGKF